MALTPDQQKLLVNVLVEFLQLRNPITFMNLGSVLDAMKAATPEAAKIKTAAVTAWLRADPRAKVIIDEAYRALYGNTPG